MNKGKIPAKKTDIAEGTVKVIRTAGRILTVGMAAGIALIALTDKAMTKAFPPDKKAEIEEKDEDVE